MCSIWNMTLQIKSRRPVILNIFNFHGSLYNRLSYGYGKKYYQLWGSRSGVAEDSCLLVCTSMLLDIYSATCFEDVVAVIVWNVWRYTPMTQHHIPQLLNLLRKSYEKSMHLVFKSLPRQMADHRSLALVQVSKFCLSSHKNFFYKISKHLLIQFFLQSEEFKLQISHRREENAYNNTIPLRDKSELVSSLDVTHAHCSLRSRAYPWNVRHNTKFHLHTKLVNTLRTGSFKLFKCLFPGFLTILTL
jgi:hypothetical protein